MNGSVFGTKMSRKPAKFSWKFGVHFITTAITSAILVQKATLAQEPDAVVISSGGINPDPISATALGSGGVTPSDGPAPSVLGALNKVFGSVKDYDQYQCLERMLCEYMQTDPDDPTSETNALVSIFGDALPFGSSTRFTPDPNFGPPPPLAPRPPTRFGRPPFRRISTPPTKSSFGSFLSGLFGRRRRRKRQANMYGNVLRLLQATKLDRLNAYPYVRAALIGMSQYDDTRSTRLAGGSSGIRRGPNVCARLYRSCPTEPDRLLDYFNNHNGGVFNQIQPSVDNEVAPILSALVTDAIQDSDFGDVRIPGIVDGPNNNRPSSSQSSSGLFGGGGELSGLFSAGDKILTDAVIKGISGYVGDGLSSLASSIAGKNKEK